jgi:penicillin-binding protein 1A
MVEDRNGKIVLDPERKLRLEQRQTNNQVVSPQNAYIMSRLLERTLFEGTLTIGTGSGAKFVYKDENGKDFRMPVAGKTGTTQNWADAWAVGYSSYYTTAIWFGFDRAGNSLGLEVSGASLAGRIWGDYMREIHQGLPRRDFARPASGVVDVTVCAKSGLLRTPSCNEGAVTLPFLSGTQPGHQCNIHTNTPWTATTAYDNMRGGTYGIDDTLYGSFGNMPSLPDDLLPFTPQNNTRNPPGNQWANNNPMLDGDDGFRSAESNRVPMGTGVSNPPPAPPRSEGTERQTPQPQPAANNPATNNTQGDNSVSETAVHGPEIPSYNFMLD